MLRDMVGNGGVARAGGAGFGGALPLFSFHQGRGVPNTSPVPALFLQSIRSIHSQPPPNNPLGAGLGTRGVFLCSGRVRRMSEGVAQLKHEVMGQQRPPLGAIHVAS